MSYYIFLDKEELSIDNKKLYTGVNESDNLIDKKGQILCLNNGRYLDQIYWVREVLDFTLHKDNKHGKYVYCEYIKDFIYGLYTEKVTVGPKHDLLSVDTINMLELKVTTKMVECAIKRGRIDFIEELKARKDDVKHDFDIHSIESAIMKYLPAALQLYIDFGIDINTKFECKADIYTPLHLAVYMKRYTLVKMLLRNGAKSIVCGDDYFTPLGIACYQGNEFMVDLLLVWGLDPNELNGGSRFTATPLHLTVAHGSYDRNLNILFKLLMDFGADPYIKNWEGKTVIDMVLTDELKELLDTKN